jgi:hypothetical protein
MPGTYSRGTVAVCGRLRWEAKWRDQGQGTDAPARAIAVEGGTRPAPRPGASGFDTTTAWGLVGLGLVGHMLRSPCFYARVAVAAIALASLSRSASRTGPS